MWWRNLSLTDVFHNLWWRNLTLALTSFITCDVTLLLLTYFIACDDVNLLLLTSLMTCDDVALLILTFLHRLWFRAFPCVRGQGLRDASHLFGAYLHHPLHREDHPSRQEAGVQAASPQSRVPHLRSHSRWDCFFLPPFIFLLFTLFISLFFIYFFVLSLFFLFISSFLHVFLSLLISHSFIFSVLLTSLFFPLFSIPSSIYFFIVHFVFNKSWKKILFHSTYFDDVHNEEKNLYLI